MPKPDPGRDVSASLHTRIVDDENLQAALARVAAAGCQLLSNCVAASVTIIERGRATTIGSTSDDASALDGAQYAANDGPCLTAAREDRVVAIDDVDDEDHWIDFRDSARANGVHASLSLPLHLGPTIFGALNVYGDKPGAFSDDDEAVATSFAAQAAIVIANAQAYWTTFDASQHLATALQNRAIIEQAKGILIARHGYSDDDAFDALRRQSQAVNRKVRDLATELVEQARRESGS